MLRFNGTLIVVYLLRVVSSLSTIYLKTYNMINEDKFTNWTPLIHFNSIIWTIAFDRRHMAILPFSCFFLALLPEIKTISRQRVFRLLVGNDKHGDKTHTFARLVNIPYFSDCC